jgi:hypothetical protein
MHRACSIYEEHRNAYNIAAGKSEGKITLSRIRYIKKST